MHFASLSFQSEMRIDVTFNYKATRDKTQDSLYIKSCYPWWSFSITWVKERRERGEEEEEGLRFGYLLFKADTVTARERAYFPRRHNLMRKLNGDFFQGKYLPSSKISVITKHYVEFILYYVSVIKTSQTIRSIMLKCG